MRYVAARINERGREIAYQVYITDALKTITENTAKFAGGNYVKQRYAEMITQTRKPKDTRTGDEIAADVVRKIFGKEGDE